MDKLDFSDLYKFTVSIGVVLIFFAILLPWLFLSNSFDSMVKANELIELTSTGQLLVDSRQATAAWYLQNSLGLSLTIGLSGAILMIFGLYRWYNRQDELDRMQQYQVEIAARQVMPLSPEVALKKAKEELDLETLGISKEDPALNRILAKSLFLKVMLVKLLKQISQERKLRVWANLDVGGTQCDILVKQRRLGSGMTWLIEVRHITKIPSIYWVLEETSKLLLLHQSYTNKNSVQARAVLCIFTPDGCGPVEKAEGFRLSEDLAMLKDQMQLLYLDEKVFKTSSSDEFAKTLLGEE
jgi:hypothetical protein